MPSIEEMLVDAADHVVTWRLAPPASVVAARARAAGWDVIHVEGSRCHDKASALAEIARAGEFPEWFGHNLDALADSLGDLSWRPGDRHLVLVSPAVGPNVPAVVIEVIREAVAASPELGGLFLG